MHRKPARSVAFRLTSGRLRIRICRCTHERGNRLSTPVKPIAAAAAPAPPKYYELASPQVDVVDVLEPLMAFVEYLGLVHRVVFNKPLVVTSGKDAIHVNGSLHSQGRAVDIRTKDLLPDEQGLLLALLAYAAPANHIAVFDERALVGQEHIHLEYHGA